MVNANGIGQLTFEVSSVDRNSRLQQNLYYRRVAFATGPVDRSRTLKNNHEFVI